jgi:2-amino-4-hydroxy-6-hydroxymethyldihydropteridine diphosphokinase
VLAYLSLGSNVGDRGLHLKRGVTIVAGKDSFRLSSVFETEPVGGVIQDDFWNVVLELDTAATPVELLARARIAELARGRTRDVHWGPRTLDVDVLLVGNITSSDPDILVPHPRMYERRFVLAPLQELNPSLVSDEQLGASAGAVRNIGTLATLR